MSQAAAGPTSSGPTASGRVERTAQVRRATARLMVNLGWCYLHEVPLPDGRRADLLGLRGDGGVTCVEIKSGVADYAADRKWGDYLEYCDAFYFAVDVEFPQALIPPEPGLIVAADGQATLVRPAPERKLAGARRRALVQRFATLAALRLAALEDPALLPELRAALRAE